MFTRGCPLLLFEFSAFQTNKVRGRFFPPSPNPGVSSLKPTLTKCRRHAIAVRSRIRGKTEALRASFRHNNRFDLKNELSMNTTRVTTIVR